jgi:hypothetical protein
MIKKIGLLLTIYISVFAEDYELGHGEQLNNYINLGGYISTEFLSMKDKNEIGIDTDLRGLNEF